MFIKILTDESHASDLLDGRIHAKRIRVFREMEDSENSGRYDPDEGKQLLELSDSGIFSLWPVDDESNKIEITAADLVGPIEFQSEYLDNLNAFCLYTVHLVGIDMRDISEENKARIRDRLTLDDRCLVLGDHAVAIRDCASLIERVKQAATSAGYKMWGGLVKYDGPIALDNSVHNIESVFNKHREFEYQREYRFVFDTGTVVHNPITLDIGDIRDIAQALRSADINGPHFLGGVDISIVDGT